MAPKPLTSRPLDLIYVIFFVVHLVISLSIDLLPLWPAWAQNFPGLNLVYRLLMDVVEDYKTKSNDPFILATWNLVKHDWEFYFMKVFMVMEVLIQIPAFIIGTYGLRKNTPLVYPLLLCYASAALVTTTTVFFVSVNLPSANDTSLDATSKFYALTDEGRRTILGPIIPFLLIPAVMWVDMLIRVTSLVSAGIQKTATAGKTGKKEL